MANLCIRQCFPRQNPKPTDSPKFYLAKVLRYTVIKFLDITLFECTADSKESQDVCQVNGSPSNTGRVSFGRRLTFCENPVNALVVFLCCCAGDSTCSALLSSCLSSSRDISVTGLSSLGVCSPSLLCDW